MTRSRTGARHDKRDPLRRPRPGTKLREIYDLLATGNVVNVHKVTGRKGYNSGAYLMQLRDFYGCEIISRNRIGSYMTGRWDGDIFVPVERLGHATDEEMD